MLRRLFIVSGIFFIIILTILTLSVSSAEKPAEQPIVITSDTLTANNKDSTAVFEGSVVAKSSDMTIRSDKMTVFYDDSEKQVKKIHAVGNVKVHNKDRAMFSDEAIYNEEKIIFTGHPKAVEGENIITGSRIILFLKEDRAVVEESKVILKNRQGLK